MSEAEQQPDKVTLKVVKCTGLYGMKGNDLVAVVKVDYGNVKLGESAKCEVQSGNAQLDFMCSLHLKLLDPLMLNEMAQTNIIVTFMEILPKEKKAKEEKLLELGQCYIDLLPLLKGQVEFTVASNVHSTLQNQDSLQQPCAVAEVIVSVAKPLLNSTQLQMSNILTLCVKSAYSIPEVWSQTPINHKYAACMPIPLTPDNETFLIFSNGLFKGPSDKEMSSQKKSCIPSVSESCVSMSNRETLKIAYEEENGDLKSPEDLRFRLDAESNKASVIWNAEQRCFLSPLSLQSFRQLIALNRYLPFEIVRTVDSNTLKLKTKEDESSYTYHGIAYVDLAPLLYPGVKSVYGAYFIHPYAENEVLQKLKRKGVLDEDVVKRIIMAESSISSLGLSKLSKQGKQDNKIKQSVGNIKVSSPNGSDEGSIVIHESQQYQDSKTYVVLGITLEKPLVRKKTLEDVTTRIAEILPPRPKFEKIVGGSKKAIEDYEKQIESISELLLEEFRSMFGTILSQKPEDIDERQKTFLHYLNTSGKYYAFKERLKYFIVKLVREKFGYKSNFKSSEDYQTFLSELYLYLIDHANLSLNKYLSTEVMQKVPPTMVSVQQLLHFAKEAEIMLNFNLAAKYYKECVARNRNDTTSWIEYGTFCMLIQDIQRAEECFKEVVSINQQHLHGLLLNAAMRMIQEEHKVAEELLDAASHFHPNDILPWTLLGLYYSSVDNNILAERSFVEANRILDRNILANPAEDNYDTKMMKKFGSIFLIAANFFLERKIFQVAEKALAHELVAVKRGPLHLHYMLVAQFQMQKNNYTLALESVEEALVELLENPNAWALKGHVKYLESYFEEALVSYERSLAYEETTDYLHSVLMRLASIYLHRKQDYYKAKSTYLELCKNWPSCTTWLGVGITSYKLDECFEAEQALNEANILDNKNPDVWSYLTLICLKCNRFTEAEQCYKYSCKLGFSYDDPNLECEIKDSMHQANLDF